MSFCFPPLATPLVSYRKMSFCFPPLATPLVSYRKMSFCFPPLATPLVSYRKMSFCFPPLATPLVSYRKMSFCFPLLATPLVSYRKIEDNNGVIKLDVLIPLGSTVMGNEPDIVCSLHTDWQRLLWVATHLLTHAVNILYLYPNLGEYMKCEHMFLIHYQIKWKVIIFVMKLSIKITCKRK
jgi:hypothetical protein